MAKSYRIRITGILIITLMRLALMISDEIESPDSLSFISFLENAGVSLVLSALIWEITRWAVVAFNRRYPLKQLSAKRFGKEALLVLGVNAVGYALTIAWYFFFTAVPPPTHKIFLLFGLLDRFIYGGLIAALYELLIFMEAWKKATQEAEELKQLNLMSQLDSLKSQVKPHFMFNNFNTLTGLVEKDKGLAVKFIAELSKVYRYLLQSNEKELVPLAQELQFTRSYFFLIQTRFREGVDLKVRVEERFLNHLIAPLTLQVLVEHAIQQNQVGARNPLLIDIKVEDDTWLVVINNLQPKRGEPGVDANSLQHIINKYKLLNQPEVFISHGGGCFTVKIPLILSAQVHETLHY
nr:sensor histidine kinase [Cesiribacter sp. SM1]